MLASFSDLTVRLFELVDRLAQALDRVRHAHLDLGESLPDGDGVLAAAVVPAGSAVEQVLGRVLAHALEDRLQLFG
jgi:hypothetical protein